MTIECQEFVVDEKRSAIETTGVVDPQGTKQTAPVLYLRREQGPSRPLKKEGDNAGLQARAFPLPLCFVETAPQFLFSSPPALPTHGE